MICLRTRRKHIRFIEDNNKRVRTELSNKQTLGRLRLNAPVDIDYQNHEVYDLGSANHCFYEGCMTWTVDQRILHRQPE